MYWLFLAAAFGCTACMVATCGVVSLERRRMAVCLEALNMQNGPAALSGDAARHCLAD